MIQHRILRAFYRSLKMESESIRWRRYRFDRRLLERHLNALSEKPVSAALLDELTHRYGVSVLRADPIRFSIQGFEKSLDRQAIAEGIGAAGVQFFPTRQSASRTAFESARESAYFSAGPFASQFFECPLARVMHELDEKTEIPKRGTILRDIRQPFAVDEAVFDVLKSDIYFHDDVHDEASLLKFQEDLRKSPLNSHMVEKCSDFFNKKATIGVRDSLRWMLGSRHPWFDWNRAKSLIESAFETHGMTDFNTPQIVYYAYHPDMDELEMADMEAQNATVVNAFAQTFKQAILREAPDILKSIQGDLTTLSHWILDIHHDYPDFDLESQGCFGPQTHMDFLGHSIQNQVNAELLGAKSERRRNYNMRAHFAARQLDTTYLANLSDTQKEVFFGILRDCIEKYDAAEGIDIQGTQQLYRRIPCVLFLVQDLGNPDPHDNERLLDAFDLSEMTQLEHASYMRVFPEISEKLVVFFALTLRHTMETEHVPDLKPRDFAKDFLVLGLWGTRTPNIRINLYVDKDQDERLLAKSLTRAEIRFVGTEQVETHPLEHIREEAKALRMAVAHFAPLIEPSILRNIGTFTMAMEEFRNTNHVFKVDALSLMHYALDMVREAARYGVKGSMTDVISVFEYLLDSTYDRAQKKLDAIASQKHKNS